MCDTALMSGLELSSESKTVEDIQCEQQLLDDAVLYMQENRYRNDYTKMRKVAFVIKLRSLCCKMMICCTVYVKKAKQSFVRSYMHVHTIHTYVTEPAM